MYVWIGFEVYYDYCNEYRSVAEVFDDEAKALVWKEEVAPTEFEWRTYQRFEVK